jgi:hypothetical protein
VRSAELAHSRGRLVGPKAKSALSALSLPIIGADGALLGHVAYDTVMNAPWIVPDTPGDTSASAGGGGPARGGACFLALLLCRRFASSPMYAHL